MSLKGKILTHFFPQPNNIISVLYVPRLARSTKTEVSLHVSVGLWTGWGDSKSPLSALDNVRDFETVLFLAALLCEVGFCVLLTIEKHC